MKKLYFLVVVLFVVGSMNAQNPDDIINIPDANFKLRLMLALFDSNIATNLNGQTTKVDTNGDYEIQVSEAQNISSLVISENSSSMYGETQFTDLVGLSYFTNLEYLYIASTYLTEIDLSALTNLSHLVVTSSQQGPMQLTSLNLDGLQNLEVIEIYQASMLTTIDVSGFPNLETFKYTFPYMSDTGGLSVLDLSQNPSLISVELKDTQITYLDVSQCTQLLTLDSQRSQLASVNLSGSQNIETIILESSPLTALDISNLPNLKGINFIHTLIEELATTNNPLLESVVCNNSSLTSLDVSNSPLLELLWCDDNSLTTLDVTNNPALQSLNCSNNQLTSLNINNNYSLNSLGCQLNQLTTLNLMNAGSGSMTIFIGGNPLESLLLKNGSYDQVYFGGNSNLTYICADENEIANLQLSVSQLGNDCVVNSYCSFIPGGDFYTINGSSILDANNNGCDSSDVSLPNLKFNIYGSQAGSLISNQSGQYSIPVQIGAHIVAPVLENPSYFTISPTTLEVTFPAEISPFTQNFCITPNGMHPDLEVVILPTTPARPGFDAEYNLIIKNKGNIQQSGSVSLAYNDAVLDYVSANPAFTTQAEGLLSWAFANLEPFETREINVTLNVNSPMETPAVNGDDVLTYIATITSEATDELPLDNTFTLPQIVVNSFDPNDKTCLEGTSITPDMIGQYVHYMIRFENTGTFAAENIVVKDMIDTAKFDVSSLVALNGSHPYTTRITGNKVEFIFEGINLPFDDANNDGYVVFKIKTLPTLVLGNSFSNTASIYFDFNHPIVTDPAVTTFAVLKTKDFEFNDYFTLYPNPTSGILSITSKLAIELQSISIYNVLGQMVVSVPNAKGISNVDVSNLSTGNYFIKIVSDKGTSNAKFIKQ